MEERIIVLALCSFSRVALFSEVVVSCSFSWILFLTARLGGSVKLCAHPGFYLHEESSVEQEVAKFTRDSLVVFSEKAVRKIYAPFLGKIWLRGTRYKFARVFPYCDLVRFS